MAKGKCSGCGYEADYKIVASHVRACPQAVDLYKKEPELVLDPREQYMRRDDWSPFSPND